MELLNYGKSTEFLLIHSNMIVGSEEYSEITDYESLINTLGSYGVTGSNLGVLKFDQHYTSIDGNFMLNTVKNEEEFLKLNDTLDKIDNSVILLSSNQFFRDQIRMKLTQVSDTVFKFNKSDSSLLTLIYFSDITRVDPSSLETSELPPELTLSGKEVVCATTYQEFRDYLDTHELGQYIAFDIETNAREVHSQYLEIVGFSIAANSTSGVYVSKVSLDHTMTSSDWESVVRDTLELLDTHTVIVHNSKYEIPAILNKWDYKITNFEDTMVASRVMLGANTGAGLKYQCQVNLNYPDWDRDLGIYTTSVGDLVSNSKPTSSGSDRLEYLVLKDYMSMLDSEVDLDSITELYSRLVKKSEVEEFCQEFQSTYDMSTHATPLEFMIEYLNYQEIRYSLNTREVRIKESYVELVSLLKSSYSEDFSSYVEVSTQIAHSIIHLVEVDYNGLISYGLVPLKIISHYGAVDAIGTFELAEYLLDQIETTSEELGIDLKKGYQYIKNQFVVGIEMEISGLHYNMPEMDEVENWHGTMRMECMKSLLKSPLIQDFLFETNKSRLIEDQIREDPYSVSEYVDLDYEIMKSGLKFEGDQRVTTWRQIPDRLFQSDEDWLVYKSEILSIIHEVVDSTEDYEDLKDIYNVNSYDVTRNLFNELVITEDIRLALFYDTLEVDHTESSNMIPGSLEQVLKRLLEDYGKWKLSQELNKDHSDYGSEFSSISHPDNKSVFNKFREIIYSGQYRLVAREFIEIFTTSMEFMLDSVAENFIVDVYNLYVILGIDIDDKSTWTTEFQFLFDYRVVKKANKVFSTYINGDKVGKGAVWVVNSDESRDASKLARRIRPCLPEGPLGEDESYVVQTDFNIAGTETFRWKCLTGDTKIPLLDGTNIPIKDLVGRDEFYVYSFDTDNGYVVAGRGHDARLSRKDSKIYKVIFDDDSYIKCTEDHPLLSRDSTSYIKVKDLDVGQSIMPLYRRDTYDGYEEIYDPIEDTWIRTHHMVSDTISGKGNWGSGTVVHHSDFNKRNNSPYNLEIMDRRDHFDYHSKLGVLTRKLWGSTERKYGKDGNQTFREMMSMNSSLLLEQRNKDPEYLKRIDEGRCEYWEQYHSNPTEDQKALKLKKQEDVHKMINIREQNPEYREAKANQMSEVARSLWYSPEYEDWRVEKSEQSRQSMYKVHELYYERALDLAVELLQDNGYINEELYQDNRTPRTSPRWETLKQHYNYSDNDEFEKFVKSFSKSNHKIKRIEYLGIEDTYSLTVDKYHNYAVLTSDGTSGVIVKNSGFHTLPSDSAVMKAFTSRHDNGLILAPDYCLVGGTRIRLSEGSLTPIEDLVGKKEFYVQSYDLSTSTYTTGRGHDCKLVRYTDELVKFSTNTGSVITCTPEHQFLTHDQEWIQAKDLFVGCNLRHASSIRSVEDYLSSSYIVSIEFLDVNQVPTYCFTVDKYHNFLLEGGEVSSNSQMEIRALAGAAKCDSMLQAFKDGADIHLNNASIIWGKPPEEITPAERRYAKMSCVIGSTKVKLADGTIKSFKELYDNGITEFYTYSFDISREKVVPGKVINLAPTKKVNTLARVTFDNGKSIDSTLDHPYLLLDGEYKNAEDLEVGDKVETLFYRVPPKGAYAGRYEEIRDTRHQYLSGGAVNHIRYGTWRLTHQEFFSEYYPEVEIPFNYHIDHINNMSFDNRKENLQVLSKVSNGLKSESRTYDKFSNISIVLRVLNYLKSLNLEINKDNYDTYRYDIYKKSISWDTWNKKFSMDDVKEYENYLKSLDKESLDPLENSNYNLREIECREVKSVEILEYDDPIQVYDMTVDKYHNYAIDLGDNSGVFTHNTFSILYGSTPDQFGKEYLNGDVELAQEIFDKFFGAFPEVQDFVKKKHEEMLATGKVTTSTDLFINVTPKSNQVGDINRAKRQSQNFPIQSAGTTMAGNVLHQIMKYFHENNLNSQLVLFIHDSIEMDVPPEEFVTVVENVMPIMNTFPEEAFGVPAYSDLDIGTSLGSLTSITNWHRDEMNRVVFDVVGTEEEFDGIYNSLRSSGVYKSVSYSENSDPQERFYSFKELFIPKKAMNGSLGSKVVDIDRQIVIEEY